MISLRRSAFLAVVALSVSAVVGEAWADGPRELQLEPEALEVLTAEANQARIDRSNRAMGVLMGWSVVNMGVGTVGYFMTEGSTRYFHQMNAAWNVVNAMIAGVGWVQNSGEDQADVSPMETIEADYRLQKILLFNMGLNIAYMAGGTYLWERGNQRGDDRLEGYGPSLVVQGGFLLLFDSAFFWLQNRGAGQFRQNLSVYWEDGPRVGVGGRF